MERVNGIIWCACTTKPYMGSNRGGSVKGPRLSQSHRTRTQTTYNLQPKETPGALNDPCLSRPVGASQHRPPAHPAQPHGRTLQVSSVERVCWERLSKH